MITYFVEKVLLKFTKKLCKYILHHNVLFLQKNLQLKIVLMK